MRFRLVPKASTLDDLELLYVEFSRTFAGIRWRVLYYDSPGGDTFVGYLHLCTYMHTARMSLFVYSRIITVFENNRSSYLFTLCK